MSGFDEFVLHTLYALRDPDVVQIFIWVSELGSTITIGGIALAVGLIFLVRRQFSYFAGLCVSVVGTIVVVFPLKELVARARPDMLYQAYLENTFSFPSGHAAFSIALYGFLAYLLWRSNLERPWRVAEIVCASLLVAFIGFSRMYLGLHYFSDVAAGYLVGGTFLSLGILTSLRLRRLWSWETSTQH